MLAATMELVWLGGLAWLAWWSWLIAVKPRAGASGPVVRQLRRQQEKRITRIR